MKGRILAGALVLACLALPTVVQAAATTAVSCGDVITRSIRVANDLTDCPGDGLLVGAPGITVDLNGHRLDGVENTQGVGVRVQGFDGVTVRNGKLREFLVGVLVNDSHRSLVRRVRVSATQHGVSLGGATDSRVSGLTGSRNESGIVLQSGSTGNRVVDNQMSPNTAADVLLVGVTGNRVARNAGWGSQYGVLLIFDSDGNQIVDNRFREVGWAGVTVDSDSDKNLLDRNVVSGSAWYGVDVRGESDGNVVRRSRIDAAVRHGVYVTGSPGARLEGNRVTGSGEDGIHVHFDSTGVVLLRNWADENGGDGIDSEPVPATLTRNRAFGNALFGMTTPSAVTDGGGNRARGNGASAQCAGVPCR